MKPLFISLLSACAMPLAFAADSAPNTLTEAEKADGWVLLFDGKDGSEHFRGYKMDKLPEGWVAEDGALVRKGKGDIDYWAAVVRPGTILFELGNVTEEKAKLAFKRVAHKMPVKVRMVRRTPMT